MMANTVEQNRPSMDANPQDLLSKEIDQHPDPMVVLEDGLLGTLHVYIHHAHDIHNICIYHKQDVYAKICLTSDPKASVSTRIINGGGRNPLFDESLQLDVRTVDCSLKCEIWMLSRVKNYLEDQLLGFALVPLPEIIAGNGSLTREFSLSSTDLFHSPAGFVQLSLSYVGSTPEVLVLPSHVAPDAADGDLPDVEDGVTIPPELDKIVFPDLNVVKENQLMVSEIFGIPCNGLESQSESLITTENDCFPDSDAGMRMVQSFSSGSVDATRPLKTDSPISSISVIGSPGIALETIPTTPQSSSDPCGLSEAKIIKDKASETADADVESSVSQTSVAFAPPLIHINIKPEQTVVQQDIVDMYMKSMQQFTDSLAKMKLPMDMERGINDLENGNSGSEEKTPTSKGSGPRVFYGSRAFF